MQRPTLGFAYRALRPWLQRFAAFDRNSQRMRVASVNFVEGCVTHGLRAAEQADLTISLYAQTAHSRVGLFAWERAWFETQLPAPFARVLVGGAGDGVEVEWLCAAGYRVDAFEPSQGALPALARALGDAGTARAGRYADLIAAFRGQPSPLAEFAKVRYDAILLGWTSLSHVLDAHERGELFEVCHALCPYGPILGSFWFSEQPASATMRGRAYLAGKRCGSTLARLRGLPLPGPAEAQLRFVTHAGILHSFTPPELEALAARCGRRLVFEPRRFPHATWLAPPSR